MTFEVKNEQQTAGILMRESEEIPPTRDRMASGIGNWELAVIAEYERFSKKLDDTYLQDLARSGKGISSSRATENMAFTEMPGSSRQKFNFAD